MCADASTRVQHQRYDDLRVNVRIIQSGAEQGSVDLADFHIYSSVFHADSRGAIRFSKFDYCSGLR